MPQYMVASYLLDNFDPSTVDEAMVRAIDALNEEMMDAGVRLLVGGLAPANSAKSLRAQPDGEVVITDGPFLEAKEHVGGFCILEAADMEEALAWARKGVIACGARSEVREIPYRSLPSGTPHPSRQHAQNP